MLVLQALRGLPRTEVFDWIIRPVELELSFVTFSTVVSRQGGLLGTVVHCLSEAVLPYLPAVIPPSLAFGYALLCSSLSRIEVLRTSKNCKGLFYPVEYLRSLRQSEPLSDLPMIRKVQDRVR